MATDAVDEIVDAVWDELMSSHTISGSAGDLLDGGNSDIWDTVIESGAPANARTAREMLRIIIAVLAGKTAGADDWSAVSLDGSKTRVSATLDSNKNRTAINTLDGS